MPKLTETKPCTKCKTGTMVYDIGRDEKGEKTGKRWKCDTCGHEDEWSYRLSEPEVH